MTTIAMCSSTLHLSADFIQLYMLLLLHSVGHTRTHTLRYVSRFIVFDRNPYIPGNATCNGRLIMCIVHCVRAVVRCCETASMVFQMDRFICRSD